MSLEDWAADIVPEGMQSLFPKGSQIAGTRRAIPTSKHMAPGYRTIAIQYTCIPDVAHPWDSDVVKTIWKFAPDFVPMWERRVLLPSGAQSDREAIVIGRHAIGRVVKNQQRWIAPMRVTMPTFPCQGLTFGRPNDLCFVHEDTLEEGQSHDMPGPYLPFDGTLLRKVVELTVGYAMTEKEYRELLNQEWIDKRFEAFSGRMQAIQDDMDARDRDFLPYAAKQLEKVSDVEMGEYMRSAGRRERPRKASIVVP